MPDRSPRLGRLASFFGKPWVAMILLGFLMAVCAWAWEVFPGAVP